MVTTVQIRRLVRWCGAAMVLVCVALSPVARADVPASGNLPRARADLAGLDTKLSRLIRRMQAQERKLGVARVRVDPAALLGTTKQLEAGTLSAARQFAPVFGLPYARTFTSLDCIDAQPALSRAILGQLEQGRLAAGAVDPSVYAFMFILTHLKSGEICSDALRHTLAVTTPIPRGLAQALRAQSRQLVGAITSMEQAEKAGPAGMRVSLTRLRQTMQQLAGAALRTVAFVPGVFYLPYAETFTAVDCVEKQLLLNQEVVGEFQQGRLTFGHASPDQYPFQFVLTHLLTARACDQALAARLRTAAPAQPPVLPIYLNTSYSFAERAADLVSRMTLAEKVAQLQTNNAPAIPRLGVQQYTYWNEGQHGLDWLGADTNPGPSAGPMHATSFPTNFAATMSWDPALIYAETSAISDEARGYLDKSLWNAGNNNLGPSPQDYGSLTFFAPTVNMDRDPRWGRTDEAFGEDPYLTSQMADAFVDGYQGETMSGQPMTPYLKVALAAKHYALNDVEQDRSGIDSDTNDTDLHDYYTAPFRSLIENAHVSGLMTSLNAINGTPAMVDTYTANQVAQRTYGFNGWTTSDCALDNVYQTFPNGHDWAPPGWTTDGQDTNATWTDTATGQTISGAAGAEAYALRAGTDLNCPGTQATLPNIEQAINAGVLSEGVIDNTLVRIFTMRMMTGEFDPPSRVTYTKITRSVIESPAHQALAQEVAANSLVLLKNDDVPETTAPLLPASASKLNKVVMLGDLANQVTLGGYSGDPSVSTDAVQGITAAVKAANPDATVVFDAAGTSTTATTPAVLSAQTQANIQSADLVVVFVGTDAAVAGEGHDRTTLAMPGNYESLIDQVASLGNPRMALVIQSDGPVVVDNEQGKFPAIVFSGYNGQSQGAALAEVLFGQQDPSGHLDFTWYRDDSQLPDMSNYGLTPASTGGLGRTYMYFSGTPTYPFGYGLSYTQFRFSDLTVSPELTSPAGTVTASFDVTNTGSQPGAAVAQLYVATPFTVPGVELPAKRLEAFQKTALLAPGQTQPVTLTVNVSDLAFWDQPQAKSVVYDGPYQFQLAYDAADVGASQTITVSGALTPHVKYVTVQPEDLIYQPGETVDLTGRNAWIADDTNHALEQRNLGVTADNVIEAVNDDGSFVDLGHTAVGYASSNQNVATVSATGILRAVSAGVATISATVGGVTGSAVVVVEQPLALSGPPVVQPGSTFTVTTHLPNSAPAAMSDVNLTLITPNGWRVSASSPSTFTKLGRGQVAQTTWNVSVPRRAGRGSFQLGARATFRSANGGASASATAAVAVPFRSIGAAFDNVGVSNDSAPGSAGLDNGGFSYSAQALAATGLTRGAKISHDGLEFTWPAASPGAPDNVTANGQAVAISGSGTTLGFLGAGVYGTATGTGTIVYTDGTTRPFNLAFADWWATRAAPGGDIASSSAYINTPAGPRRQTVSVYYAAVSVNPRKKLRYVVLPVVPQPSQGPNAMHLFAIAVG